MRHQSRGIVELTTEAEQNRLLRQRLILEVKEQGPLFFLPFLVLDLLLPAIALWLQRNAQEYDSLSLISGWLSFALIFLPYFSTWAPQFTLAETVQGQGKECLRIRRPITAAVDALLFFSLYIVNLVWILVLLNLLLPFLFIYEFLRLLMISIFLLGFGLLTAALTGSHAAGLLLELAYVLICIQMSGIEGQDFWFLVVIRLNLPQLVPFVYGIRFPFYLDSTVMLSPQQLLSYLPYLILGLISLGFWWRRLKRI